MPLPVSRVQQIIETGLHRFNVTFDVSLTIAKPWLAVEDRGIRTPVQSQNVLEVTVRGAQLTTGITTSWLLLDLRNHGKPTSEWHLECASGSKQLEKKSSSSG